MSFQLDTPAVSHCKTAKPSPKMVSSLLNLSDELLHEIFILNSARDLAALRKSCRTFNAYVKGNRKLWKDNWLGQFVSTALVF